MKKLLQSALSVFAFVCVGLTAAFAQTTATWTGGGSDSEWNTGANWDTGSAPLDSTTNAVINSTSTVNYNLPMAATSFGTLTENGVLNVNTNGFNSGSVAMLYPGGTGKISINPGATMNVTGNFGFTSNSVVTLNAGASLTVSGTLYVGSGSTGGGGTGTPGSLGVMTNNGGYLNVGGVGLNSPNGSVGNGLANLFVINGGTNNLGNVYIGRASGSTLVALDKEGLVLNGGLVNIANLLIGNNSWGLLYLKSGVTLTNTGYVTLKNSTALRPARFFQTGGLYVNTSSNAVFLSPSGAGNVVYSVTGGTNIIPGIRFGDYTTNIVYVTNIVEDVTNIVVTGTNYVATTGGVVQFTNAAMMYIGAQGISTNGTVTNTIVLGAGGTFRSSADWTNNTPVIMAGGVFDAQDASGAPHNIYSSGALRGAGALNKSGAGTMTLDAANIYSGNTIINNGVLALGASGSLANSPAVIISSGATFDVSAVSGYTLGGSRTIGGFGSVNGNVTLASGAVLDPGTNLVTGTLSISGSLTETGGAIHNFNLSSDPAGPNNDVIVVGGDLNLSGTDNILNIAGGGPANSVYPLFKYSGTLNGSLNNLTIVGPTGVLTNITDTIPKMVAFVVSTAIRTATNVVWNGNALANNWDVLGATNWLNNGSLDYFVNGDSAVFNDVGVVNSNVNLTAMVTPGPVMVNAAGDYYFTGAGSIVGAASITKTNSGRLFIQNTNQFTGGVSVKQGSVSVAMLAGSGEDSPLGRSGTILLDGGTLEYTGPNVTWTRSLSLGTASGAFSIADGITLTSSGGVLGVGPLVKAGNGTLVFSGDNSYSGGTVINAGSLTANSASSLGSSNVNLNGGTLVLGAIKPANTITVITNSIIRGGNTSGQTGIGDVNGSGNLTVAVTTSSGVFDLGGNMTSYSGTITFTNVGGASVRFNGTTGSDLATWDLGATTMDLMIRSGSTVNRLGGLKGSTATSLSGRGGASNNGPTTYLIGANNQDTVFSGTIQNGTGGSACITSIAKTGAGTLTLNGGVTYVIGLDGDYNLVTNAIYTNALFYTGSTVVSNGVLAIAGPAALITSTNVTLASSSAVLDFSQKGEPDGTNLTVTGLFEVPSSQTLAGFGTIRGSLITDSGSTFKVGLPGTTGILTVTNAVTLGGTTTMKLNRGGSPTSDRVVSSTASVINYGGTLIVTNIGSTLHVGDTFTLFSATSLANSSFGSTQLPSEYGWDTTQLAVNGTITVTSAPTPPTPPTLGNVTISGSNITLTATGGTPNAPVSVLSSTNVALPLAQWTVVTTGNLDGSGNYSYTITGGYSAGTPQMFYVLQSQ